MTFSQGTKVEIRRKYIFVNYLWAFCPLVSFDQVCDTVAKWAVPGASKVNSRKPENSQHSSWENRNCCICEESKGLWGEWERSSWIFLWISLSHDWPQKEVFVEGTVIDPSLWLSFGHGTKLEIKRQCTFLSLLLTELWNWDIFMFGNELRSVLKRMGFFWKSDE